jgi:hypothetical protein
VPAATGVAVLPPELLELLPELLELLPELLPELLLEPELLDPPPQAARDRIIASARNRDKIRFFMGVLLFFIHLFRSFFSGLVSAEKTCYHRF